jgi:hypothetical protein
MRMKRRGGGLVPWRLIPFLNCESSALRQTPSRQADPDEAFRVFFRLNESCLSPHTERLRLADPCFRETVPKSRSTERSVPGKPVRDSLSVPPGDQIEVMG